MNFTKRSLAVLAESTHPALPRASHPVIVAHGFAGAIKA